MHVLAVLPIILPGELGVVGVVLVATEALAGARSAAGLGRALAVLVVLAGGAVLRAEVPVHVDRADAGLPVRGHDGLGSGFLGANEGRGNVGGRLLVDGILRARKVVEAGLGLLAVAHVRAGGGGLVGGGVSSRSDGCEISDEDGGEDRQEYGDNPVESALVVGLLRLVHGHLRDIPACRNMHSGVRVRGIRNGRGVGTGVGAPVSNRPGG